MPKDPIISAYIAIINASADIQSKACKGLEGEDSARLRDSIRLEIYGITAWLDVLRKGFSAD